MTAVLNQSEQGVECLGSERNRPVFVEKHALGRVYPEGSEGVGKFCPGFDHGHSELSNKYLRRISDEPKSAPRQSGYRPSRGQKDDKVMEKFRNGLASCQPTARLS